MRGTAPLLSLLILLIDTYVFREVITERGRESPLRKLWDERPISWRSQACKDLVV